MKTKYPEKLWVGFSGSKIPTAVTLRKSDVVKSLPWWTEKRYRLDRGNEVARILNVMDDHMYLPLTQFNTLIKDLRQAGFKVRYDSKKGKFV